MSPPSALSTLAREVVRLAFPAIVAGLAGTLVFFTDRLMLGRFSADALGSMQVSGPVLWSVHSVFGAFAAGTLAVVGRASGAGQTDRAERTTAATLLFALGIGVITAVLGFVTRDPIAALMTGSGPETAVLREHASIYMGIVYPLLPFVFVAASGTVALQAAGDTQTPMRIGILTGLINLGVSGFLLFGWWGAPRMGIAGAAIGTAAAFTAQALLTVWALGNSSGRRLPLAEAWAGFRALMRPVLRIAGPAFGEKLIFHVGFLVFASIVGRLGAVATAANQSLIAIESLGFIAAAGFGVASSSLVARKLGAQDPAAAATCGWLSVGLGAVSLSLVSVIFLVFAEELVTLFTPDAEVVALGARCLRVAAIAQPLMAISDSLAGALRGAGDTRSPMVVALVGPVVVRLAACWWLTVELDMGLLGIWIGTTLDWAVRGLALGVVFARGRWMHLPVIDD